MLKFISLLLLPLLIYSHELEVQLNTRSPTKPIYVSDVYTDPSQTDWRYFEELRNVLAFDLNTSGFCRILDKNPSLEEAIQFPDVRSHFDIGLWKKEKIPYVLALQVAQNRFYLTAFNIENGTSKKYPDFLLKGRIEDDRRHLHSLVDMLQKDLFGVEGISSLRIIYSRRVRNFDAKEADWFSEIWVSDFDGANSKQMTHENSYCISPSFLPMNSPSSDPGFFYVTYKSGQSKIHRATLSNPKGEPMIELRGNQALPSLSRNGKQMAFITDVAGRPDLFIQNLDPNGRMAGKARQLFSAPRATQASPTFSPDGKQIAFVSDKDGPPRIYLLPVAGPKDTKSPHPRLITKKNRENTSPAWSPDGKKLAYSAKTDGVRQIWIYDFAADEEIQLTTGSETKENPSWAPDSLHLVYNTEGDDICEIYLIDLNQREPIQISKGSGQKRFPSWEPR